MNDQNEINEKVLEILAELLGVEKDEILPEFSFSEDLHMSPANLTDFLEKLSEIDIDSSLFDMTEIETVGEFLDEIEATQPIE